MSDRQSDTRKIKYVVAATEATFVDAMVAPVSGKKVTVATPFAHEQVVAGAANNCVGAPAAEDCIISRVTEEFVVTDAANECVIAGAAVEGVISLASFEN